jgi:DNA topoisomerase-1
MAKNLVIVESPAKARTIERYLGKDFQVESSFGHIADLPSKEIGIDIDDGFKPIYKVSSDKKSVVKKLRDLARKSEMVWLASDEDREGEAIAWHLSEQLKLDPETTRRIVFHEITKKAILSAVANPRGIDYNLVNAQQARRVLDRLVGYELSPVLWRKIKGGLSAGRVQSVAVRLIVERERAIANFKPKPSYKVVAQFLTENGSTFQASLPKNLETREQAENFLNSCVSATFKIDQVQTKPAKKSPAPPFTTSTLQQEASRKLYFPVARTMMVAQRLYEAGLITYMRTDSTNLSDDARKAAAQEITSTYGEAFSQPRNYTRKSKGAQEAHEAIRPTDMGRRNIQLERDQKRLYDLIWKRTIASQMSDARLERTQVWIANSNNSEQFVANGEVIKFEGFLKVYLEGTDSDDEEHEGILPALTEGALLKYEDIRATQRFTKPPYRFSEASLVKRLEELGIGRPSTYAPTISTIQRREYVEKKSMKGMERNFEELLLQNGHVESKTRSETVGADRGKLVPTDIGNIVNDFLVENFEEILDFGFTAKVESQFDAIAEGTDDWTGMISEFYTTFHPMVKDVAENADRAKGQRLLGVDPESGKNVYVRLGRFGAMVQIGEATDSEKPRFASLQGNQTLYNISFEEAMDLFRLPKSIGTYEDTEVQVATGRFGPYVRFGKVFLSLDKDENPLTVDLDRAIELIEKKRKADAPIGTFEGKPVQKGVGRYGPFIKWDGTFINVPRKYNFENLSQADIESLIVEKRQKDKEKIIHEWTSEGIRVEHGRWGKSVIIKGRTRLELPKTIKPENLTLEAVQELLEKNKKKRKTTRRKPPGKQ